MENIKDYIKQLLEGMKYVHKQKVCHRDLKPENILLTSDGIIKICDFGSAKILNGEGLNTPYIVSRYYRAPELILACSDYTSKIDIWGKRLFLIILNSNRLHFRRANDLEAPFPWKNRGKSAN